MIPGWQVEGYERLRAEIVKSAVDDYKKALKKSDRLGCRCAEEIKLKKWFLSNWGQLLCEGNGEYIMEKCCQTYKTSGNKKGKQHIPDDIQKRVYKDYLNGVDNKTIIERYGISHSTIHNIVRRWEK